MNWQIMTNMWIMGLNAIIHGLWHNAWIIVSLGVSMMVMEGI